MVITAAMLVAMPCRQRSGHVLVSAAFERRYYVATMKWLVICLSTKWLECFVFQRMSGIVLFSKLN